MSSSRRTVTSTNGVPAVSPFLTGGREVGELIRTQDWSATPLGSLDEWTSALKTSTAVMLGSSQPMFIVWGSGRTLLYNQGYSEILASKHPEALGHDFLDVWHEYRDDLVPIVDQALRGEPVQGTISSSG